LIKNSQPFGKKFQKTVWGDFFDSHCISLNSVVETALKMISCTNEHKHAPIHFWICC